MSIQEFVFSLLPVPWIWAQETHGYRGRRRKRTHSRKSGGLRKFLSSLSIPLFQSHSLFQETFQSLEKTSSLTCLSLFLSSLSWGILIQGKERRTNVLFLPIYIPLPPSRVSCQWMLSKEPLSLSLYSFPVSRNDRNFNVVWDSVSLHNFLWYMERKKIRWREECIEDVTTCINAFKMSLWFQRSPQEFPSSQLTKGEGNQMIPTPKMISYRDLGH